MKIKSFKYPIHGPEDLPKEFMATLARQLNAHSNEASRRLPLRTGDMKIPNISCDCQHCNGTGRAIDHRALGNHLRSKRVSRLMSLREMARRMNFTAAYLSDLEKGRRQWSKKLIDLFEKGLEE